MNLFNNNIKFMHFRQYNKDGTVNARGGMTVAYYEEEGGVFSFALTQCSKKDNYSRFEGRSWAVKRFKDRRYSGRLNFGNIDAFRAYMEAHVAIRYGFKRCFGKKRKTKLSAVA